MIFNIINFVIFIALMSYFLRKPLGEFLSSRRDAIREFIDVAKRTYDMAEAEEASWRERLDNIRQEISGLMRDLKMEGESERRRMVEQAKIYAERLNKETSKAMEHETTRAIQNIKRAIAEIAISSAEKRLSKEMVKGEHLRIAKMGVSEVEASP